MLDLLDTLIVRDLVASLSPCERKLARLLMAGHTQTSAARELGVTFRSVRYRLRKIRRRFGENRNGDSDRSHEGTKTRGK